MKKKILPNGNHKPKIAFVTFSSRALASRRSFFLSLLSTIEKECGYIVKNRWFEDRKNGGEAKEVFLRSQRALKEADVFIAEVSQSSTGVGQQIFSAIQQKLPTVLCLDKKFEKTNAFLFLKGTQASNVYFVYYAGLADLKTKLRDRLGTLRYVKLEKFNFMATNRVKEALFRESEKRGVSQSELLRSIVEKWIAANDLN